LAFVAAPAASVMLGTPITSMVAYVDGTGNRDTDVTDTITVTASAGGAASGNSKAATAGLVDFQVGDGLTFAAPGFLNGTLTFIDDVAGVTAGTIQHM